MTEKKIQVKLIGSVCCFEGCDSSAKYYFNFEELSYYLCENHFNKLKKKFNCEFEINYDERKINAFTINGDFGIKSNFLMGAGHIISKMNQDKNWKNRITKESQNRIDWHYGDLELKLIMDGDIEGLKELYRKNPHQFPNKK